MRISYISTSGLAFRFIGVRGCKSKAVRCYLEYSVICRVQYYCGNLVSKQLEGKIDLPQNFPENTPSNAPEYKLQLKTRSFLPPSLRSNCFTSPRALRKTCFALCAACYGHAVPRVTVQRGSADGKLSEHRVEPSIAEHSEKISMLSRGEIKFFGSWSNEIIRSIAN